MLKRTSARRRRQRAAFPFPSSSQRLRPCRGTWEVWSWGWCSGGSCGSAVTAVVLVERRMSPSGRAGGSGSSCGGRTLGSSALGFQQRGIDARMRGGMADARAAAAAARKMPAVLRRGTEVVGGVGGLAAVAWPWVPWSRWLQRWQVQRRCPPLCWCGLFRALEGSVCVACRS